MKKKHKKVTDPEVKEPEKATETTESEAEAGEASTEPENEVIVTPKVGKLAAVKATLGKFAPKIGMIAGVLGAFALGAATGSFLSGGDEEIEKDEDETKKAEADDTLVDDPYKDPYPIEGGDTLS